MRIVQINTLYRDKSTGRTTMEMHQYLREHGYGSFVFCVNENNPKDGIFSFGSFVESKIHAFMSRVTGLQGYFSIISTLQVIKKLNQILPDVVILRVLHSNCINFPIITKYLSKRNIPTILVLHDCWYFTGRCVYYTADKCDKWKTKCFNCKIKNSNAGSWFFDTSSFCMKMKRKWFSKIDNLAVVGVSQWVASEAKQSYILGDAYINKYIYNWIDSCVFKPHDTFELRRRLGIFDSQFVILGVASHWSELKGLSYYIKLAKEYQDAKVVLVGSLPLDYDYPNNIIKVGNIKDTKVLSDYYSMADVFVNFSVQETFGKVSAEAISCGTPVVSNAVTANTELCGDGCGYTFNNGDWAGVKCSVEKIMKDGKSAYSERCVEFARENFDMATNIDKYLSLFQQMTKM